jgi:hypothetical protein
MTETTKNTNITLPKTLAERLSLLRKFKHRAPEFNDELCNAIRDVVVGFESKLNLSADTWTSAKSCPECKTGLLIKKKKSGGKERFFYGCNRYPLCKHSHSIGTEKT